MTKEEETLLLYLETRAVDHAGKVDSRHMNGDDFDIARRWNKEQFIEFGRRPAKLFMEARSSAQYETHYVVLSAEAWTEAHRLRSEKANWTLAKRLVVEGKEGG